MTFETDSKEFWSLVKKKAHEHDMDEVLAYMHLMIEKAREAKVAITRKALSVRPKSY